MVAAIEITGLVFGKLTAVERAGSTAHGQSKWLCECACGERGVFPWASLKTGGVQSCGCVWKRTFETTKICPCCKRQKEHSEFSPGNSVRGMASYCRDCNREKQNKRYHANPVPRREYAKQARSALRDEVLNVYGAKCACCGEGQRVFLAIDHMNNDGAEHRRSIGGKGGDHFYKWLKANNWPAGFQTLCQNCNWGKYVNGGICPHVG